MREIDTFSASFFLPAVAYGNIFANGMVWTLWLQFHCTYNNVFEQTNGV